MKFTIEVKGVVPPSPNALIRKHWRFRWRAVKEWQEHLFFGLPVNQRNALRAAAGIKQVSIEMHRRRAILDPDNAYGCYKVILDAGTKLCFWPDDSAAHVKLSVPVQVVVKDKKDVLTRVTIEVLP
jgi:hypothetical protein